MNTSFVSRICTYRAIAWDLFLSAVRVFCVEVLFPISWRWSSRPGNKWNDMRHWTGSV